ncbi:MAG TPA: radical SAM protein [bacterium]|nr:radical SAM protein [bacterium]
MKIFISYPPLEGKGTPLLGQNRQFQWFSKPSFIYPMVPASAATLLRKHGHDVFWDDAIAKQWTYDKWWNNLLKEKPDLIAIETKTPVIKQHWKIVNEIKKALPNTKVVLMGDHVTALPDETLEKCDGVGIIDGGDYDFALLPPSLGFQNDNGLSFDLNKLPMICRDLTQWQLYGERLYKHGPFTYTMAGRDCQWGKCTFCSWTTLYPTFNVCSPEKLLDEIAWLIEKYGIREIFDDTGTFPAGRWTEEFCLGMIKRGLNKQVKISCNMRFDSLRVDRLRLMKAAGFRLFKLGLESANQKTLDRLNKGMIVDYIASACRIAKRIGFDLHLTIMVGYPWETRADVLKTYELAKHLMESGFVDMLQATIVIPYPGTPLYEEALKNDWFIIDPTDYEKFDMSQPVLRTPDMSPAEVVEMCNSFYRLFLKPKFIWRYLRNIRSRNDVKFIANGAKAVIGHLTDFGRKEGL